MAKYDSLTSELKNRLPGAQNVLIAIPSDSNLDETASAAGLFLALQSHGKNVQIASDKLPQVTQANIYGAGSIKNTLVMPQSGGMPQQQAIGDYTLVLEGVATAAGTVPSLEKLDWYAENNNLNLVFHTLPGQSFQPGSVYPKSSAAVSTGGGNFDLVFVIGAANLAALGNIYSQNPQAFSVNLVNIDKDQSNQNFGQTNIIDQSATSIAEMLTDIIPSVGLPFDRDIATNMLAGIFEMTQNLATAGPDTYVAVGNCLKVGGQKPLVGAQPQPVAPQIGPDSIGVGGFQTPTTSTPAQPMMDFSAFLQPKPAEPIAPITPVAPAIPTFNDLMNQQAQAKTEEFTVPPIAQVLPNEAVQPVAPQPSPEERPAGERVVTDSPEPGWLTPKVFKGSSVG